jgi:hypothetical protein
MGDAEAGTYMAAAAATEMRQRESPIGMKKVGNDRRKAPPLSLSDFSSEKKINTIFLEMKTMLVFLVISETKIYCREHIDNDQSPSKRYFKNDKHIKQ